MSNSCNKTPTLSNTAKIVENESCFKLSPLPLNKNLSDEELRNILQSDSDWNNEAIENLITIRNGIDRHYAFAESAIPTDVFKPNISKIEGNGDAYQYFQDSIDEYEKLEIDKDFYVLWVPTLTISA